MTKSLSRKTLRQGLFLGSLVCISAGLSAGFVMGDWGALPVFLLALGGALLAIALLTQQNAAELLSRRSTKAGTNAIAATLAVLTILGTVNFVAARYSAKFDVTERQLFTLAPQTQEVVKTLATPVKVWIFDRALGNSDRDLLDRYRALNPKAFDYELVDPVENLTQAQAFGAKELGAVFIEKGERRTLLTTLGPTAAGLSEVELTKALAQASSDRTEVVYFLQGHGERPLEGDQGAMATAIAALGDRGFEGKPLSLTDNAQIPEDAAIVAIIGPQRPLLPGEVTLLREYSDRGGNLMILLDPQVEPVDAGLGPLLETWGIQPDGRVAIDASPVGQLVGLKPDTPVVTQYGDHPIVADFRQGISYYPVAQPMTVTERSGITATRLLETGDQSWAESDLTASPLRFEPDRDLQGPLTLGVALERSPAAEPNAANPAPSAPSQGRLVAIGNSTFVADGWFDQQLNGDVFLNAIGWLGDRDDSTLSVRPREPENRRITLTALQGNLIALLALAVFPLLGFGSAGVIWWRSR